MGDNLLRQQIRNFRKRRDLAKLELATPGLYERPEIIETLYAATPRNGEDCVEGEVLYAFPDDNQVALVRGHRKVAFIDGDSGRAFSEALFEPDAAGVVQIRVMSVAPLSGAASVQIIKAQQ